MYFLVKMEGGVFHCYVSLPDFLGGGFKCVLFSPPSWEKFSILTNIFQMG